MMRLPDLLHPEETNVTVATAEAPALLSSFTDLEKTLNRECIAMSNEVHGAVLALIAGASMFMHGPSRVGKTHLADRLALYVHDPRYFGILLSPGVKDHQVFGPLDHLAFKAGVVHYLHDGFLPKARLGCIDEVWQGSNLVTNALLGMFGSSKQVRNGAKLTTVDLATLLCLSNRFPGPGHDALYARLDLRFDVQPITDPEDLLRLLQLDLDPKPTPILHWDEVAFAQLAVDAIPVPEAVQRIVVNLVVALRKRNITPGPGRLVRLQRLMRAEALLDGANEVQAKHLDVARNMLWDTPDQKEAVANAVAEQTDRAKPTPRASKAHGKTEEGAAVDDGEAAAAEPLPVAAAMCGVTPGYLTKLPAAGRIALAKRLNARRMKAIANRFTGMAPVMWAQQANRGSQRTTEIEFGSDLDNLDLDDLFRMGDPDLGELWDADLATEALPQHPEESPGRAMRVLLEDGSNSMTGARELAAKAVALCVLHLTASQRREFRMIHFGAAEELWEMAFATSEDWTPANVIAAAEVHFGGGTDFEAPLTAAVNALRIEHEWTGRTDGDILMLTDGQAEVPEGFVGWFKQQQRELGFTLRVAYIGGKPQPEPLATLADGKVTTVGRLLAEGPIGEVFKAL